jgi:ubiquinone/menaquinone biosynthesis C-methylase UbiE
MAQLTTQEACALPRVVTAAPAGVPESTAGHRDQWNRLWNAEPIRARSASIIKALARKVFAHHPPYKYFLVHWLNRFLSLRNQSVLEVGGTGRLAQMLHREISDYTLLDYSDSAVASAKQRLRNIPNASCVLEDMFHWQPERHFDIVLSAGLIEHFVPAEQAAVVAAHARLSRRYVCIGAPSDTPHNWWRHYRLERTGEVPWQRPVSEKTLSELCAQSGLMPVAMTRLDPFYARQGGRLRYLSHAMRAAHMPNRDWGIDRVDGGLVFVLAEKA